jgi:hypothetical protein
MSRQTILLSCFLLIFMITGPACSLAQRLADAVKAPEPAPARRVVVLPPAPGQMQGQIALPTLGAEPVALNPALELQSGVFTSPLAGAVEAANPTPVAIRTRRPTPTPATILNLVAGLIETFGGPAATPTRALRLISLPTVILTPTGTPTPLPTDTPLPTETPLPTDTPLPTHTPLPVLLAQISPVATPGPTVTPAPQYDFLLGEFFNSPTSNNFLLIYVAIVDPQEIPIGDMKVVGTRLDHNLTYESPLSTWHYEGYSAPGEVVKSGNVKFEPPGGIETTDWVLHLEDNHGQRLSEDVPFRVDAGNKQWYFIKFRRKF